MSLHVVLQMKITLQPRNYQVSKEVVHKLKFGDIGVMQI